MGAGDIATFIRNLPPTPAPATTTTRLPMAVTSTLIMDLRP